MIGLKIKNRNESQKNQLFHISNSSSLPPDTLLSSLRYWPAALFIFQSILQISRKIVPTFNLEITRPQPLLYAMHIDPINQHCRHPLLISSLAHYLTNARWQSLSLSLCLPFLVPGLWNGSIFFISSPSSSSMSMTLPKKENIVDTKIQECSPGLPIFQGRIT